MIRRTIMKKIMIILPTAALCLSSCGIYTTYKDTTEVPDNLYGEVMTDSIEMAYTEGATTLGDMAWDELFTDPALQELIRTALENNSDLRTAALNIEEAKATLTSAKLSYLPSFAFAPNAAVSSWDTGKAAQTWSAPVTASWQLDVFGSIRNNKKRSQALYEQSLDYEQAVRSQLIANVANTYYTLCMLDEQLAISEATELSWKETIRSAQALMRAGKYNQAGVSQMEASYHSVQTSVVTLREQINTAENTLSLLLCETPRKHNRGALVPIDSNVLKVGIPLNLLAARPDVRSAERTLEAAFYNTNAARSAFYPQITLSGSAGWTNSTGSAIINPGKLLASAAASLTQPIFSQGKLVAQLKIARAQQESAAIAFNQTLLQAGVEVNEALTAWQTANEKDVYIDQQVESLKEALRSTSLLMDHGTATYLEVMTAMQSLLSAQLSQVANHCEQVQSVINLYQALGGGSEDIDSSTVSVTETEAQKTDN